MALTGLSPRCLRAVPGGHNAVRRGRREVEALLWEEREEIPDDVLYGHERDGPPLVIHHRQGPILAEAHPPSRENQG